jgi:hypothetical protein
MKSELDVSLSKHSLSKHYPPSLANNYSPSSESELWNSSLLVNICTAVLVRSKSGDNSHTEHSRERSIISILNEIIFNHKAIELIAMRSILQLKTLLPLPLLNVTVVAISYLITQENEIVIRTKDLLFK